MLNPPGKKILLHCCCAVCAGDILQRLTDSHVDATVFFYNPNIHPRAEYDRRKAEILRYAGKLGVPVIDADYDTETWFDRVKGLEKEPEKGRRCTVCFDVRLGRTALYAHANGFNVIATTLGISRRKDLSQVNAAGHRAAAGYDGIAFWDINWRKNKGIDRMIDIARAEGFYRQEYCGCVFSRR
jgi:predicted adenine nucleotide alpha hydrolase (AANH) superfamily ATPase